MTPNQYTFRYRVGNGPDYNRALIARGQLTTWFDENAVAAWRNANQQNRLKLTQKAAKSMGYALVPMDVANQVSA